MCKMVKISSLFFLFFVTFSKSYDLKQVLILSRHNIRAPLSSNLHYLSSNTWPIWNVDSAFLTAKGALLEGYMGRFISNWLVKKGLLPAGCPEQNTVRVYANTRQRTKATANAFVDSAFKNCNITVYSKVSNKMDPIFNPIIRNDSKELKSAIINEMEQKLRSLNLNEPYSRLNDVVDIKHAKICEVDKICDFERAKDDVFYEIGKEPNVNGPLGFTNSIVDAFIMSYYEGMNITDIAWGNMRTSKEWKLFSAITRGNMDVRFNSTVLAKEVAKPLLKYIYSILYKKSPNFTLLVGHDSNLMSVMAAIGFKPYVLPDQYEVTPIGGKLVFQRWHDRNTNEDLLKIEYVYQTMEQLRNGDVLTEQNPPKVITMHIDTCENDIGGFCKWNRFISILKSSFS
ncbi:glucose-1-phosphatase-like [Pieris brassicae]|uniref:glucose-1-phosphatase-like n=1 Tax=Pieris brassicae TaxID=7116 RepID=UPI001E6606AE|nr:glucose-1-phosphatase-like [Pieris brassicae]